MSRYKTKNDNINLDSPTLQEYVKKCDVVALYIDRWGEGSPVTINLWIDLMKMKQADVAEVKHGHWIEHIVKPDWLEDDVEVYYNCSECGTSHWSITPPYCPECGAKMDGERKEQCEKD